ncbi:opioid-binding protein/cell adhesion molecule homolog isoform X2 [Genypterus blacodes]|uniref:opioid-binding protein/cell adhesion molecule homolog isoform X2 n=1 Tax=Genypterus blacodes TaxID=154954 RepID=UPI003F76452D
MKTVMWFGLVLAALSAAGEVIQTRPDQHATITCGVESFTKNLEWRRGMFMMYNINGRTGGHRKGKGDIMGRISIGTEGLSLRISSVEEGDAGEFTCTVDGAQHRHTLLVVSVSVSPSADLQLESQATLQCQVRGLNPTPTVEWERPDGSPAGSEPLDLQSVSSSDAGTWMCKFSHDGNKYKEPLDVRVKVPEQETPTPAPTTPQSSIQPSCRDCIADLPPDEVKPGLSWWMWAAVGGGSLSIVLLTITVLVLCKRKRRRRRKLLKVKKAEQLLKAKEFCQCKCPAAAAPPPQGRRREKPSALPLME